MPAQEVQSFTLDLENRGLMLARPGDVLPPGYLTSYMNLTANRLGFIESRNGSQLAVSSTVLPGPVHSQGRIIIRGTPYIYQGVAGSLYRAFNSIATGFSGNILTMRDGGLELGILPQLIVFDSAKRVKDNGITTTNFGIAGPMAAATAVQAALLTKSIDTFEYLTNAAIQAAWSATGSTVTTTPTNPYAGSWAGNMAVGASFTGQITRVAAMDLSKFVTAGDSTDEDYIAIAMRADNAALITEIRILLDVDPTTNDFTRNFYWKSVTPNLATTAAQGTVTAQQAFQNLVDHSLLDGLQFAGIDNVDPTLLNNLPPEQLALGASQWAQIFVRKSDFVRVGTHPNNWANVAALRIQVQTTTGGTVNLGLDDFKMQNGNNLDAADYDWIYRYKSEVTGTHSPFSPVMLNPVAIAKASAIITVRNPRDTQATHIELYRRGGDNSIFSFAKEQLVTAWTGTTTITDSKADADLGATTDLTQIELASLSEASSAISTSVRKTVDNGATYTDYTSAVGDDNLATYADLSGLSTLANGDWLLVGADAIFRQILVHVAPNVNTNPSALTVQYWNGTTWRSVKNMVDGTSAISLTFGQDGTISFDFPDDWAVTTFDNVAAFYVRLSVSATLSGLVRVSELRVGANEFDPTVCEMHAGRLWCDDSHNPNRMWYSERFAFEEFLEDNFIILTGADPLVRPFALDDQLFAYRGKTVDRVIGSDPDSFQPIPTGSETGLFSKSAICKGNGKSYYRAPKGIYALPGSGFSEKISVAIDPLFHGIASPYGDMFPVDDTYAATETMEFFDNKIWFGYTDATGTRREITLDFETDRWEPTDRPVTSYLRLDDLGLFYSGHTDGHVYQREIANTDQGTPINLLFRTQFLDFGAASREKRFTEIVIDADLDGANLKFFADFDNFKGVSQSGILTNSDRGPLNFPLGDDTDGRNIALRLESANGSKKVKFFKITFFYIILPTPLLKVLTDWDDLGFVGTKYLRQLELEIDTHGSNVQVAVQVDGVTSEILLVNTALRQIVPLSLIVDTIGRLVRLIINGTVGFDYYRHEFEFLKDAIEATKFATEWTDLDYDGLKLLRELELDINTGGQPVNVDVQVDGNTEETLAVSTAVRQIVPLSLNVDTFGKLVRLVFNSADGVAKFKYYKHQFEFLKDSIETTKLATEWTDLGYPGDKRLQQLELEINTHNSPVTVQVQADGATTETITVTTSARQVVPLSLVADTIGKVVRIVLTGDVLFNYYTHRFIALNDPIEMTRYDTVELDFNYTRWKFIRRVWIAAQTPATVTMTITIDEVRQYTTTFTIRSDTGWTKRMIKLPPGLKGMVFRFVFTSTSRFKVFLDQSDVEWHRMAGDRSYERAQLARVTG